MSGACQIVIRSTLIERDLIAGAIVELGRARAFMRGHGLGVLQRAAGFEVGGDAGCSKRVTTDPDLHAKPAARRWIMRQASIRFIGFSVSAPVRPAAERKRGALPPSPMPAASI